MTKKSTILPNMKQKIISVMEDFAADNKLFVSAGAITTKIYRANKEYYDNGDWKQTPYQACRTAVQGRLTHMVEDVKCPLQRREEPKTQNVEYYLRRD